MEKFRQTKISQIANHKYYRGGGDWRGYTRTRKQFNEASQPVKVQSKRTKLQRRTTNPESIKWPKECSLLEFTETPTYLTDAFELCYQQYVKRDGPKAVNIRNK